MGANAKTQIRIKDSKEYKSDVDRLLKNATAVLLVGTSSWKNQFREALTVSNAGDDDNEVNAGRAAQSPDYKSYVVHVFTIFWKLVRDQRRTRAVHDVCDKAQFIVVYS